MKFIKDINRDRREIYASDGLIDDLYEAGCSGKNCDMVTFAYTDYGGDIFDRICIEYFESNHPESIVWEHTAYFGKNAIIFGEIASEFIKETEDYLLGFRDLESFYSAKTYELELDSFRRFIDDELANKYDFNHENVLDWLMEHRCGYYSLMSSGDLDFCSEELIETLIRNSIITAESEE